ncbi:MAG TPA: DUF3971 domain-containing protein [Rhizomicrobium sp.]|nr:DUF3971 domain-containing protein [Rhizomicrobium sp.]
MKLPFVHYVKAHHISRAALCVGVVVAAVLFFAIGAGIRLLVGPVSLGPLKGTLAEAIQEALPGIALDYDQAAIEWSRDQGRVNLVILGARIYDRRGRIVARAPKADIDLAAAPFLQGRFEVRRITLIGVQFSLVHMKSGGMRLGTEKDRGGEDVIGRLTDVINAHSGAGSSLRSFAVRDAKLAIFDEDTGLSVVAPRASLIITAKGQAIEADFDADVGISGRRAHLSAAVTVPPGNAPVSGTLSVAGLDLRALGANAAMFAGVKKVALTTDFSSRFTIAAGSRLTSADFDLTAKGEVPADFLYRKALHVNRLRLLGHYNGTTRRLVLESASLDSREAQLRAKATAFFTLAPDGRLEKIHTDLSFSRMALDLPGLFAAPVGFGTVSLSGDYWLQPRRLDVARLRIVGPSFSFESSGSVTLADGKAPGVILNGQLGVLSARTLLHYWPLTIAPGAREWLNGNIYGGTIGPIQVKADFPPGLLDQPVLPDDSMTLTFPIQGVEGNYLSGLTHATQVSGEATLTGDTFTANFTGGRVGPLIARAGRAVISDLHHHGTIGEFSVHVDGAMPDVMALIDMKPLGYPTRFGIDPRQTHGAVSADLDFHVPMLKDVAVDDVGISVKAAVSGFGVLLGSHTRLTDGSVDFEIDNNHLHQTGTVSLADSRLAVDWTEDFNTSDPMTTRLAVKGTLTEAARDMLNIRLGKILTGAAPVNATLLGHRGQLKTADMMVDMTPLVISAPIVNLGKPAGTAAMAHLTVDFAPGAVPLDETIRVTGPGLTASGTASFDKTGELTQLNLPVLKMGALNDLSFTLLRGAGGDDYILRGHSLDGSKIGHHDQASAKSTPTPPHEDTPSGHFHINARLDRVALRDGVSIAPFNLDLTGIGDRPATLSLSGSLSKGAAIAGNIETVPAGRKLTVTAGDAGLLARGLFTFESLKGGKLTLVANFPGAAGDSDPAGTGPDYQGSLTVRDFKVLHQPLLARLFSAGSLTGMSDLMQGEGISMGKLELPFISKNSVLSVAKAEATGRAICVTADGYIDRPKGIIDLKGSLVPACGLNSVLGNVPLLGDLLVSKKGEGIFGVTYSLTGDAEQPSLSVNPAALLTPGILRRLFEGRMPNAANAPSNLQNNAQAQENPKAAN